MQNRDKSFQISSWKILLIPIAVAAAAYSPRRCRTYSDYKSVELVGAWDCGFDTMVFNKDGTGYLKNRGLSFTYTQSPAVIRTYFPEIDTRCEWEPDNTRIVQDGCTSEAIPNSDSCHPME